MKICALYGENIFSGFDSGGKPVLEAFIYINIGYINFDLMPPMLCNSLYEMSGQFLLVGICLYLGRRRGYLLVELAVVCMMLFIVHH